MTQNLITAINAAVEAGKDIMAIYNSDDFEVSFKSDDSPLTKADMAAHHVIVAHLKSTNIPVLSEEGKAIPYSDRKHWNQLWIVDPIDGTKEFIKRNGEFTVNIALIENNNPVLGVVFVPALGELYFSTKMIGSFKVRVDFNDFDAAALLSLATKLPIQRQDSTYTVVASRSHRSFETDVFLNDLKEKHGYINIMSKGSSLKLCMVAEGMADCYPRFAPTMEWDTAAGQAICEHAGCSVIDWETKVSMLYNRENLLNNWFLVSNEL